MKRFIEVIFPNKIDNEFNGSKIALYTFYVITIITLWRSQHHMLAPDGGAQSIASIPLDTFLESGANAVISIFAFWGLSQLIIGIIYMISVIKYKSLIPLFYLLIFVEYFGRWVIGIFKPLQTIQIAPGVIGNYIFMAISIIMLILCFYRSDKKVFNKV